MNAPAVSSGSSGSPRLHGESTGLDGQGPTVVNRDYLRPTDGKFVHWVDDDHPLIAKDDFWANQKNIQTDQDRKNNKSANKLAGQRVLKGSRPKKKSTEESADSSLSQTEFGTKGLTVAHPHILSHLVPDSFSMDANSVDSIKAVS